MTSHPSPAAQVFADGGDLLDMLRASRELTHACAVRMAWITEAMCHALVLAVSDMDTCRACRHGQALALGCPGGPRVALPPASPLPAFGGVTPESAPAARLCGETQPVAAPTPGPGPCTAASSTAGGPGATGRKPRPKTDPAELRRRKAERKRRARADAALKRKEEREQAKAERMEEERRQAKVKAAAKAQREREAHEREQSKHIRLLAETLAYLIPRHGEKGTLGLRFTRLIFTDRTNLDLSLPEFRALCEASFLTITGRSSAAQNIHLDDWALAFAGLKKEAA